MAKQPASAPPAKGQRKWVAGCCGGVFVLGLLALLIGLVAVRSVIRGAATAELAKAAPAERWEIGVGLFAPVWWLTGQSTDVSLHGVKARITKELTVSDVLFEARLRFNLATKQPEATEEATFTVALDEAGLTSAFQQQTSAARMAQDMQVKLADQKLKLTMKSTAAGFAFTAEVVARPRVEAPATLAFDIDTVTVDSPVPALKSQAEGALKAGLRRDFRHDFSERGKQPVKLTSAAVRDGRLEIAGTIDLQKALGGKAGAPPAGPKQP